MRIAVRCLIAATLTGLVAAPAVARARAGQLSLEPYVFESDGGERIEAERGRLLVPEDRSRPTDRLVELAFVRFRSTSATPGSPIVYLAGGPGGSGIEAAHGSRFPLFMALRAVGDVIALDQRGTGRSLPELSCPQTLGAPLDRPGSAADLLRRYRERSRACVAHWSAQGVSLSAYNTVESAEDLETLRVALGAPRLTLWGISYGTHLALAYLRRHSERVDRAILAGVEGPDHTYKLPAAIERVLSEVARRSNADPGSRAAIGELVPALERLVDELDRRPLRVELEEPETKRSVGVAIGGFDLRRIVGQILGGNPEYLPAAVAHLARRDAASPIVRRMAELLREERAGSIGSAMTFSMDCASGASSRRLAKIRAQARRAPFGSALDFPFPEVCDAWPGEELGPGFRAPVRSRAPVLLISGTLDARTPPANATEVLLGLRNGRHLVIDGAAHSDPLFLSSPLILERMLAFLRGERVELRPIVVPLRFVPAGAPEVDAAKH